MNDQIVPIWLIVYDNDFDTAYSTSNYEKMLASVESSIRGYAGDDSDRAEDAYRQAIDMVKEAGYNPIIPIKYHSLTIVVYRIEIEKTNQLHKLLIDCYNQVDDTMRQRISSLFCDSVNV